MKRKLNECLIEITDNLENGIIPFWLKNGIDKQYGGYLTNFDENGNPTKDTDKYIVTQTRMIWGFSAMYREYKKEEFLQAAKQGVLFFINHFWDEEFGGWCWKTNRKGSVLDSGKVVYGQTFAIYALSEYTLVTGDQLGLQYASKTFDLLQKYCTDTEDGGYYENLERDWTLSPAGFAAGDLKSLDIHMHTMEAYTTLYECSQQEIHKRKLEEIINLLLKRMINSEIGYGYNQFDIYFNRKPASNIRRTWNAERETGEVIEKPTDTTSYGHNIEFVWLINRACEILKQPYHKYDELSRKIANHTLKYGFDHELGGVFRDGPHEGAPLVRDKEWWQNCEVLIGFLDVYERLGDEKYGEAFIKTWEFDKTYMINEEIGEWRQLLTHDGKPLISNIGNPWKAIYHTGRAMLECKKRLERILGN
ncbi:AGE family epimerase/isomerase [Caproiciproducens sp.]